MKKYTLLFLFFSLVSYSQIINFPDANLKAKLLSSSTASDVAKDSNGNNLKIDTNSDGEIQLSEALNVYKLDVSTFYPANVNDIVNVAGMENFTNLRTLDCSWNQIQNLNLNSFTFLEEIAAHKNILNAVNISGLTNLKKINFNFNQLTSISIDNLTQLQALSIIDNDVTSLTFNNNPNLESVYCYQNAITSLDFTGLPSLLWASCGSNQLTSVNIAGMTNLEEFLCDDNNLTNLNLDGLSSLRYLSFGDNQIASINLSSLSSIIQLYCQNNPLSVIDVDGFSALEFLTVSGTLINTIDCSQTGVRNLTATNCPNLSTINLKNNVFSYSDPDLLFYAFQFDSNPQLQSICLDNGEQNNLAVAYNVFNYNTSGSVQVFTGDNCDVLLEMNMAVNEFDSNNNVIVFPNPTNDLVTIQSKEDTTINSVEIYNTLGQLVENVTVQNTFSTTINLSRLNSGTYFVTVFSEKGKTTQKLIKL